jgi:hypothetical protein
MLALWLQRRQAPLALARTAGGAVTGTVESVAGERSMAAEQHFPVPIVVAHGLLAATILGLVLLTAINVGGS